MKLRTLILAGTAALLVTPAFAGEGMYVGLGAGWDDLTGPKLEGFGVSGKLKTKDTATLEGTFGYKFNDWRVELETGWSRHDNDTFTTGGITTPAGGDVEARSLLANASYDFHLAPRFILSIGAGAGVARDPFDFSDPPGTFFATHSSTRFMWQAVGGFSYEAARNLDLFVDYHYRDMSGNDGNIAAPVLSAHDMHEHAVIAGLRWYAWAPHEEVVYQAPPPPPPPLPPPPPAPVKTFIVFFDFNKSNLTSEAQNVVAEAVKTAQTTGAVRVVVTGHTDTVGSDSYNQALSERRAESVKSQMVADGLGEGEITTTGKSFHDPLVATGPNVREPQNRRAVIDLGG